MSKFYVAGPMRGYEKCNFPAFDECAATLRDMGHEAVSPAEIDRELGLDDNSPTMDEDFEKLGGIEQAMHRDFGVILECDGIVLMPGWEQSTGARGELFVAQTTGRQIFLYDPDAENWDDVLKPYDGPFIPPVPVTEVRVTNATTGGQKGTKLARFDLLPAEPLFWLAEHYGRGSEKYADRNWELGYEWSLSFAAMMRHAWSFWNGEDIDPETGSPHLAAVAWHAFALMEWGKTHPEFDNRVSTLREITRSE